MRMTLSFLSKFCRTDTGCPSNRRIQFTTAAIDNLIFLAIAMVWLLLRGLAEAKLSLYSGGSDLGGGAPKEGRRFVNSSILLRK